MVSLLRCCLAVAVMVVPGAVVAPTAEPADKKAAPVKPLDILNLPANAIIVVIDKAGDLINITPLTQFMKLEDYQKLVAENARLRDMVNQIPIRPSQLRLKGRVEGNRVFLKAEFEFATDRPRTTVSLGCKPARANNATLSCLRDGTDPMGKVRHIPALRNDDNGLSVYLDEPEPKGCTLTLDLTLEVSALGTARSFDLKLPKAAATVIDLILPDSAHDVRLGDPLLLHFKEKNHLDSNLGAADKLTLSWKEGKPTGSGPRILEAEGKIHVRLHERRAVGIEARLTLKVRGSTDRWELLVPLGAKLDVDPADEPRLKEPPTTVDKPFASLRTILLKEASDEPLHVIVTVPSRRRSRATTAVCRSGRSSFRASTANRALFSSPAKARNRDCPRTATPHRATPPKRKNAPTAHRRFFGSCPTIWCRSRPSPPRWLARRRRIRCSTWSLTPFAAW